MPDKKRKELDSIIKLRKQGASLLEIGAQVGRSASYVKKQLDAAGNDTGLPSTQKTIPRKSSRVRLGG